MPIDASTKRNSHAWTLIGLAVALLSLPLIAAAFRFTLGGAQSLADYLTRELANFLALAALAWIILRGERLSFVSIGWRPAAVGRSLLWGLLGAVLCAVGLAVSLGLIQVLGLHFGGSGKSQFDPPVWAVLITVLRAGVVEEVFYRGFAMERLVSVTGSRVVAFALPLAIFAAAHYRQGTGGVLIALVMGAILATLFWKRRDLLAVITAHFVVDLVPNVILPLLGD